MFWIVVSIEVSNSKAFDRVPWEVVWWALWKVGAEKWLINAI